MATVNNGRGRRNGERGMTLIEVLIALIITGIAATAFVRTVKSTISANKSNRKYIDITGALTEVLDSVMTLPVTTLDGMNGSTFTSRQGVGVTLMVSNLSQSSADAIISGMDVSRLRNLKITAVSDTSRTLGSTVSNYQQNFSGRCFTQ